jgi:Tfp pilus assembly protein PilX
MFGFSSGDWIFIVFIMIVIFTLIGISDMRKK